MRTIRIGSGAGYSGDRIEPAVELAEKGEIDYLVFECLGERTVALAQQARMKNPESGYDPLLEERMRAVLPICAAKGIKIVTNMGAANPEAAAKKTAEIAKSLGLEPARMMDILSDTSGGPNVLKVRGAGVAAMLSGGDGGPVTFDIDSAVKDLRTMLAEGKDRGVELPLVAQTLACYEETKRNVSGAAEVSAVSVYWANRAKP